MTRVLVPLDLLDAWRDVKPIAYPLARLYVTAVVLAGWGDSDRFDAALRDARMYWPQTELDAIRPRPTVLSVLDQLERLGVCRVEGRERALLAVQRAEVAA